MIVGFIFKLKKIENNQYSSFKEKDVNAKKWRLFITSDMESIELEAIKEFGQDRVIRIEGVNAHVDRESNLNNDCTRIEKPILDFHFLQNCDKAIISKESGFGQLGLWNREKPYEGVFYFKNDHFYSIDDLNGYRGGWIYFILPFPMFILIICFYFKTHSIIYFKLKRFQFFLQG